MADAKKKRPARPAGTRSREKGVEGERELIQELHALGFSDLKRGLSQARGGGVEVADIQGMRLNGHDLHPEVKRQKSPQIGKAYRQAWADMSRSGISAVPVAITRADGEDWLVTIGLHDFVKVATSAVIRELQDLVASAQPQQEVQQQAETPDPQLVLDAVAEHSAGPAVAPENHALLERLQEIVGYEEEAGK